MKGLGIRTGTDSFALFEQQHFQAFSSARLGELEEVIFGLHRFGELCRILYCQRNRLRGSI